MCKTNNEHNKSQILEQLVQSKYNKSIKKYDKLIDFILKGLNYFLQNVLLKIV